MPDEKETGELDYNPLRSGKSFIQRMEELIPKAQDVLKELKHLRKTLENGWTDDW